LESRRGVDPARPSRGIRRQAARGSSAGAPSPKTHSVPDTDRRVNHFVEDRRAHATIRCVRRDVDPQQVLLWIDLAVAALHRRYLDAIPTHSPRARPVFPPIPFPQSAESCIGPARRT
jgi:hypothetical protein